MDRIYEFYMEFGVSLSCNRRSRQEASLRVQPFIRSIHESVRYHLCLGGIESYKPVVFFPLELFGQMRDHMSVSGH